MYQRLKLPDSDTLACLFFRGEGEANNVLAVTDFERRIHISEGGLSFFRLEKTTLRNIIFTVERKPKFDRGLAIVSAGHLESSGFQIFGHSYSDPHVCLHCPYCNGAFKGCAPSEGHCPFLTSEQLHPDSSEAMRRKLVELLKVAFDANYKRDELLLNVFGRDVAEDNIPEANQIYAERWHTYKSQSSKI